MSRVFPGVFETFARSFLSQSAEISEDLPALDRPVKAMAGMGATSLLATALADEKERKKRA
jgi:hypothetical protein